MPPPAATRRTALTAGVLGGLVGAGCTADPPPPPDGNRRSGEQPGAAATAGVVEPPDLSRVREARAAIESRRDLVRRTVRRHRRLRSALAPLDELHAAHARLLAPSASVAVPGSVGGPAGRTPAGRRVAVPRRNEVALRLLGSQEATLQRRLAELAGTAVDGTVARVLASMSAAVAQQAALLPGALGESAG